MSGFSYTQAVRKAVPMLISIAGPSGSGKTYGALLMAAGIAGPNGKVGFLDTENGRGSMYADSPGIKAALPNGFMIARLDPPFHPRCYIEAIEAAELAGVTVLVIDSGSHEWEGIGGCCDIAELDERGNARKMPNWKDAKLAHKRFMNRILSTNMHIIFCLRAREKVKMVKVQKNGREATEVIPIGMQPIAEKSFVFEALLSLQLNEQNHFADPIKVPEPLAHLFNGSRLITKKDGEMIREWNSTGAIADPNEQLLKRARLEAQEGMQAYSRFFESLTKEQKKVLADTTHKENKAIAEKVDSESAAPVIGSKEKPAPWPETFDGPALIWNGDRYEQNESGSYTKVEVAA